MDSETAMATDTRISVYEAMAEIENHGHQCYVCNAQLYATSEPGEFEFICIVVGGMVRSRTVMLWLGY